MKWPEACALAVVFILTSLWLVSYTPQYEYVPEGYMLLEEGGTWKTFQSGQWVQGSGPFERGEVIYVYSGTYWTVRDSK